MSNFAEVMADNPVRLVVEYQRQADGSDGFQWGIVGNVPIISLIGAISKVCHDLCVGEWSPDMDGTPPALVMVYDQRSREFTYFKHPDIPVDPLVGMLDVIKAMLVDSRLAQQHAAQKVPILGPDGRRMR